MSPCYLTVWIWCELPLPPLLPEAHQVCQRNNCVKPPDLPLQEWQSKIISDHQRVLVTPTPYLHFLIFSLTSQPLMDCAVCYKTANNEIESIPKPYVHCIQRPRLTVVLLSFYPVLLSLVCTLKTFLYETNAFYNSRGFRMGAGLMWQ